MSGNYAVNKFTLLLEKVPKFPEIWTQEEIKIWLEIIGMESYAQNFEEMGVDGYLILDLEEQDIEEELQISKKLHRRKIIKAIQVLKEYTQFLKEFEQNTDKIEKEPQNFQNQEKEPQSKKKHTEKPKKQIPNEIIKDSPNESANQPVQNYDESQRKIVIKSIEGPNDMNFTITTQGMQIGRHSTNQIVIFDESVSRYHANIYYKENNFFLTDIGSTTGTFIKVQEPLELKEDMILEIGSYQFNVSNIFVLNVGSQEDIQRDSFVEFTVYESPDEINERVFKLHSGDSIGRKQNNKVCFSEDLHMSNLHCKINLIGEKFNFEDIASTNGSWLRLSKECEESDPYQLVQGTIFKIGNSAMYEVFDPEIENKIERQESGQKMQALCCICWSAERDCLLTPCRHNVTCTKCIKNQKICPICRTPIHDIILIYKSQSIIINIFQKNNLFYSMQFQCFFNNEKLRKQFWQRQGYFNQ